MNWLLFAILTYGFLLMQVGLKPLLGIPNAQGVSPDFLLIFAVFIGIHAHGRTVAWAMLTIGLIANLLPGPIAEGPILGPEALGYLMGAFAVLQFRTLVFRESVISLVIMVVVVGIFIQLVTILLYTGRGMPLFLGTPVPNWDVWDEMFYRFLMLLYSAVMAIPVGLVLLKLSPALISPPSQRG